MAKPVLGKPIPAQVINEMASYGPFDLKTFIQPAAGGASLQFSATLKGGAALPKGLIVTADGLLTGIPARDTQGIYEVIVSAQSGTEILDAEMVITIKPSFATGEIDYLNQLKTQIWEAVEKNLPLPELGGLMSLPITKMDIYYLVERWGTLTIWNALDLTPAGEKHLLTLEGVSSHYNVFDRGSSLVMAPKDLFSYERTTLDGIQTAKAMAREVYKRGWTIEMAGLDKWTHATWIELQILGEINKKPLEIVNYQPSRGEMLAYQTQAWDSTPTPE